MEYNEKENWLPPERLQAEEQAYWEDIEYLLSILPAMAREIFIVAEAVLDQYEYEGSPIYSQYPDQVTMRKIAEDIKEKVRYYEKDSSQTLEPLTLVILMWNINYRRQRYWRRKRVRDEVVNRENYEVFK